MWLDPVIQFKSSKIGDLKIQGKFLLYKTFIFKVQEIETALSILKIRRTILNLLPIWPVAIFQNLNQHWQNILDLLKLAGAGWFICLDFTKD